MLELGSKQKHKSKNIMNKEKTSIKEVAAGRSDMFKVNPMDLFVVDNFNVRDDFDLVELKNSIKENGVKVPLTVRMGEEGKILLVDGERRLRAVWALLEEGVEIATVPCIVEPRGYNDEMRTLDLIVRNDGKPLTPIEEARVIARLLTYGWEPKQIALKTGRSQAHVSNALLLNSVPAKVAEKIKTGKIASTLVLDLARETKDQPEKLVELVEKTVQRATDGGKKKATRKHLVEREPAKPKFRERVEAFLSKLVKQLKKLDGEEAINLVAEVQIFLDDEYYNTPAKAKTRKS